MARKPLDQDLYDSVVAEAKRKFAVWPSAYASGWVVKTYKDRGGRYAGAGRKERAGLTKWFGENWVDLSRPIREGGEVVGYEPCGRKKSDDPADYPKCRPAREAMRMSPSEVKDAIKRKRAAEAKASEGRGGRGARAPVRVATYRNPLPPQAVESDLLDAIEHADVYGDQGWTLDDFDVRYVGPKSLRAIRAYEDWGAWIDTAPEDYAGLSAEQRLAQLEDFRGKKWAERAAQWYATGKVPPVVAIEAPIVSEDQLDWQIGDGRGRINFALAMGLRTLPVIEMRWRGARTNPRTGEYQGEHLPPGPDDGAPMHDVDNMMPDYCAHPDWYFTGAEGRADAEAASIVCATRGRPWATVWVYRAVPPGVTTINPGDWVTQVRDYAKEHLESNLGGKGRILKTVVRAGSLFTEGNSHFEWGWWPDAEREREFERMLWAKRAMTR